MNGQKVLNILPFQFFLSFFFRDVLIIPYELFLYYLVARALLEKAREGHSDNTGGREPPTPSV